MPDSDVSLGDLSGDRWYIALQGEHDLSNVSQFQHALDGVFATGTSIVLDLSTASFIDSTVLHTVIDAYKRASDTPGEQLVVVAAPDSLAERVLSLAGLKNQLPVYEDRQAALDALSEH